MALRFSGSKLRSVRETRGLSQEQLARTLDTRPTNVSKWENNKSAPNGVNMVLLTRALNCTLEDLCRQEVPARG